MSAHCIEALKAALGSAGWTQDVDIVAPHLTEWRDRYQGQTPILLTPQTTDQVVKAVQICAQYNQPVMPQGGNTGLVGGNTPQGEVLLSTRRLNRLRGVNAAANIITVEAGMTLSDVQKCAGEAGRKFPLSLASEGSCTIGGNLSTNAGGVHVIKYGTTKDLVSGVEAVLPDGRIFNGLTALKKDNTGYDLSRLFLGAEGTLGIITAASLRVFAKPTQSVRVMCAFDNVKSAMALLERAHGPALTMFEIMPRLGMEATVEFTDGGRDPFDAPHPWYGLIDFEFFGAQDGQAYVERLIGAALENGIAVDAVIAQSGAQASALLALRENMSAAQKPLGASIKHDVSVPVDKVDIFLTRADAAVIKLVPGARPLAFGHLGDGNIHYNITAPIGADRGTFLGHWEEVQARVHDIVDDLGGSISAEHGIGILKKDDLATRADSVKLEMLRAIKLSLDPQRIMNPRVMI